MLSNCPIDFNLNVTNKDDKNSILAWLASFSSRLNDRRRRIWNFEPRWVSSLRGCAAQLPLRYFVAQKGLTSVMSLTLLAWRFYARWLLTRWSLKTHFFLVKERDVESTLLYFHTNELLLLLCRIKRFKFKKNLQVFLHLFSPRLRISYFGKAEINVIFQNNR